MNTAVVESIGPRQGLLPRLSLLRAYRELMWMLAWRDIRVRYKHSLLGGAWAVLPLLAMMVIFTFVFGTVSQLDPQKLTGHPSLPYWLFAFSGLVPWTFFANGLTAATGSLVSNRQLVTKVYFPREVFPIAAIGSAFVDFLIASAAVVVLGLAMRFTASEWRYALPWTVVFLPLVVAVQVVLMLGLGLLLSMANLFYRDVGFLFRSVIQLWMFLTCVVYQLEPTAAWKWAVVQLNPMTPIIRAYRECLLLGQSPLNPSFGTAAAVSFAVLLFGWLRFARSERDFAEHI